MTTQPTQQQVTDGVYIAYPDGGAWTAWDVRRGKVVGWAEESDVESHRAANDSWGWLAALDHEADVEPIEDDAALRKLIGYDREAVCFGRVC